MAIHRRTCEAKKGRQYTRDGVVLCDVVVVVAEQKVAARIERENAGLLAELNEHLQLNDIAAASGSSRSYTALSLMLERF